MTGRAVCAGRHPSGAPGSAADRIKNQVHAILNRNLVPTPPMSDLFGTTGRHWVGRQVLPTDEQTTVQALLRLMDFHGDELKLVDTDLAKEAIGDLVVARVMTIPGVDAMAAISILAAVGDFSRFHRHTNSSPMSG